MEPKTVEEQIKAAACECGLMPPPDEPGTTFESGSTVGAAPVAAWGDGKILEQVSKFMQMLLQIALPLILKKPTE
jgi:hypothetical protein